MDYFYGDYLYSNDKSKIQIDQVELLLKQSYWAAERALDTIRISIEHSVCYGIYDRQNILVGFARVITDHATTYYICDVLINEKHRGKGLGKELIRFITQDELFKNLLGLLLTRDAHGLYEKYGFTKEPEKALVKFRS